MSMKIDKTKLTREQLAMALECKTAEELVLYDSTAALTVYLFYSVSTMQG